MRRNLASGGVLAVALGRGRLSPRGWGLGRAFAAHYFRNLWPGYPGLSWRPIKAITEPPPGAAPTLCYNVNHPGRLAQLVRARASHARGRRFESCSAHHSTPRRFWLEVLPCAQDFGSRLPLRSRRLSTSSSSPGVPALTLYLAAVRSSIGFRPEDLPARLPESSVRSQAHTRKNDSSGISRRPLL